MTKRDFDCTAEELRRRGEAYLQSCREAEKRPTDAGLARALDIPIARLELLAQYAYACTRSPAAQRAFQEAHKAEKLQYGHLVALQAVLAGIRDALQQGKDTMSLFCLKQPIYGGYADKADKGEKSERDLQVQVRIQGMEGGADPFE